MCFSPLASYFLLFYLSVSPLKQGPPNWATDWYLCQIRGIRSEIKDTKNVMLLNHPETIHLTSWSMEKLSSTKTTGAKMVGDRCPTEFMTLQFSCSVMSNSLWTPWTTARQGFLSITNSQSLPRCMSIESVMPSNHLLLCHPLLLPSILPSIRVFSNESALCIRWPKYWSFSFNISPSNEHPGLISFMTLRWSYLQSRSRDTDEGKKWKDTEVGSRGGMNW